MYELSLIAIGAVIGLGVAVAYAIFGRNSPNPKTLSEDNPDRRALFAAIRRHNTKSAS